MLYIKANKEMRSVDDHGNTCVISCLSFNFHIFDNRLEHV